MAPFVLDDRPLILLRLGTPLWRDLWPGSRGEDVLALQKELRKLGHKGVVVDGYYGRDTSSAVAALWKSVGGDAKQSWVPRDQVVWLPRRSMVPESCPLHVGDQVEARAVMYTVGGGLESLTIELPVDATVGTRVVVNGETVVPVEEGGLVQDRPYLGDYAKTRGFQEFLEDRSKSLEVTARLAEPIEVAAVPPSSLYDLKDGYGCVADESGPLKVQVVASQLGETFVSGEKLPSRVLLDPKEAGPPCG
jgi:hypothetical protein